MATTGNKHSNHLPLFVLDVLRYDMEQVPSVTKLLNDTGCIGWRQLWPHDFTDAEVIGALEQLTNEGLVQVLIDDPQLKELAPARGIPHFEGPLGEYWFRLSDAGRDKWAAWNPPTKPDCAPEK